MTFLVKNQSISSSIDTEITSADDNGDRIICQFCAIHVSQTVNQSLKNGDERIMRDYCFRRDAHRVAVKMKLITEVPPAVDQRKW
jgi:hypothetical protein